MTLSYTLHRSAPPAPAPVAPNDPKGLLGEWRTAVVGASLAVSLPRLARAPRGDGAVVIDIPGWRSPESSLAPLRHYLARLGHDARGWGRGTNLGRVEADAEVLSPEVVRLAEEFGRPVALVGWSLGGVIAREVARSVPAAVRHVVTLGTPAIGGPTYTLGGSTYGADESARLAELSAELDRVAPIQVPVTAVFSRRDSVVHWPASIDRTSPAAEHVEVGSPHFGMTLDPNVWWTIAHRLADRPVPSTGTVPDGGRHRR